MNGLFRNFDLLSVGVAVVSTVILGFIVFFNNRKSITNSSFLLFCLVTSGWGIVNYLNYQIDRPEIAFWFIRLTIFLAIWQAYAIFQFFYVFPKEQQNFSRLYKFLFFPWIFFTSFLTLTPLVFAEIAQISPEGRIVGVVNGPAIPLFGLTAIGLVVSALGILIRKTKKARDREKTQLLFILIGTVLMFALIIVFNFLLPAFFNNPYFIPLGAIFTLPFLAMTSYAILVYKFLNTRVVMTEIFILILLFISLLELVQAKNLSEVLIRGPAFIGLIVFGILLIKNFLRETELKDKLQIAYADLKKLDEAKSEFLSIASHQLRTPLSAIKGYISMILEGTYGELGEKTKTPLKNVYQANERLIKLVNDLLNLSRIEAGRVELEMEKTSLEEITLQAIEILKIGAKNKNLYLKFEKPKSSLPPLWLDKQKTIQAILNIVDNAIRYTEEGGVTLTIKKEDGTLPKVLVKIKDTGVGMDEEELVSLFESFSRGQAGSHYWTEGIGLGLYVAQKFISLQKGRVWAESEGKGKGSTFYIELPA
ncbi:MAG: hypothetical protein HY577_00950 [Candidatus Nealsonbacteria bacterium]|nr:hypothetical protein [Candidatus Nealsonbacteria bacterium]